MLKIGFRLGTMLAVSFTLPATLRCQDQPLTASGTFSTGYYSTYTHGDASQTLKFVPFGARFDVNGYYITPDLLSFSAQPELGLGPQASDAGFQGGNGTRFQFTLLRKRIFPLTFHYSNLQIEDVYFGSLSQLSSYTLQNRTKDLGLTWEFKPRHLPATIVDWGTQSVDSKAGLADVPDYRSHGSHVNVDSKWERGGWDLEGFLHHQQQTSDLFAVQGGGITTGSLLQTVTQYQGSGRRSFFQDSELYVDAGSQSTATMLFTLPIDLTTHYVSANLRLFQRRRWKTALRTTYSSNLASQLLAQATNTLGGPGSVAPDGIAILLPYSHGLANLNLNGVTSVALSYGFGLYGGVERNEVFSSGQYGPLNANYFTTSAGVTYAGRFRWGHLSGQYGREFGLGSITGQSGTIQGQNYLVGAQHGVPERLQVEGTVRGSDQTVHNAQPVSNRSFAVEASVARRAYRNFGIRLGGGWEHGTFINSANEFRSSGYTARAGIEHPRIQISAFLNDSLSNSLPFYSQLFGGIGVGSVLVTPLQIIPSDYRAMSFTAHSNPMRKVEVAALWTRSRQHLDGVLNNDFQLTNVYVKYHFRRIDLEAGFIRSNQIFASYPTTQRQRLYIRVVRTARLL
jgi:hypothetical protein